MPGGEVNYVHEAEIWRQQLKNEVESKSKYQHFLDSVCEDPSEYFESIENIRKVWG